MREFPILDDFSVTEYGEVQSVDPRTTDVLRVSGKAHIEYCYENEDMLCSIDSSPDDGKWRWMIIQRRPYMYMDDGNLGGTDDLLSAYAEAKLAYDTHRATIDHLRSRLDRDVVVELPEDAESPFDAEFRQNREEQTREAVQAPQAQPAAGEAASASAATTRDGHIDEDYSAIGDEHSIRQTPLREFADFEDLLDKFFSEDEYAAQSATPEHYNVDFGQESYSRKSLVPDAPDAQGSEGTKFDFDMDIDEFLGLTQPDDTYSSPPRDSSPVDALDRLIHDGLGGGAPRWQQRRERMT